MIKSHLPNLSGGYQNKTSTPNTYIIIKKAKLKFSIKIINVELFYIFIFFYFLKFIFPTSTTTVIV